MNIREISDEHVISGLTFWDETVKYGRLPANDQRAAYKRYMNYKREYDRRFS